MRRRLALALFVSVAVAAVTAPRAATVPDRWTWKSLHRPLHIPRIVAGAACPVSALMPVDVGRLDLGQSLIAQLPGPGPAFPGPLGSDRPTLFFNYPPEPDQIGW